MSSPTRWPVDLGRGISEELTYWPDQKLLQMLWKNPDGSTRELNITPDNLDVDPIHRQLWEIATPHREWLDLDEAGKKPPPESAPPGLLDNRIYIPPNQHPSIPGIDQDQQGQHQQQPPAAEQAVEQLISTDTGGFPTIVVDLQTFTNMQTLIEIDSIVIESLTAYLEDVVEDKASKKIIQGLLDRNKRMRGKYLGEFTESD